MGSKSGALPAICAACNVRHLDRSFVAGFVATQTYISFSIVHCRERHEYFSTRFCSFSLFFHLFVEEFWVLVRVSAECAFYRLDFTDTPGVFHRWCRSIHLPGLRAFQFCLRIFFCCYGRYPIVLSTCSGCCIDLGFLWASFEKNARFTCKGCIIATFFLRRQIWKKMILMGFDLACFRSFEYLTLRNRQF